MEPSPEDLKTPVPPVAGLNRLVQDEQDIWCLPGMTHKADFAYSDGASTEAYLRQVFDSAVDLGSRSTQLEAKIIDWPTRYHLSPLRSVLFENLAFNAGDRILELGAGCGSISRYLGEKGLQVDAVEGSPARALLARKRCAGLDAVNIINANFNDLELPLISYDAALLVGVLEYAKRFSDADGSHRQIVEQIIARVLMALRPQGVVLIAIENRAGLKYLLDAPEDHYRLPAIGLYDYLDQDDIRTYTRSEWIEILQRSGLHYRQFLYPFPDYKLPRVVVSERFADGHENLLSMLKGVPSEYEGEVVPAAALEAGLQRGFYAAGRFGDFANSFLILASRQESVLDGMVQNDFVQASGLGRHPQYRTLTRKPKGKNSVIKSSLHIEDFVSSDHAPKVVEQKLTNEIFRPGGSLAELWQGELQVYHSFERLQGRVRTYYEYLKSQQSHYTHSGEMLDLLPQNIILDREGRWFNVDHEWVLKQPLDPDFVLFRALFYFTLDHLKMLHAVLAKARIQTLRQFIDAVFKCLEIDLDVRIEGYIALETAIQQQIMEPSAVSDIKQELEKTIDFIGFPVVLTWECGAGSHAEPQPLRRIAAMDSQAQTLEYHLPPAVSNIVRFKLEMPGMQGFFHLYGLEITAADRYGVSHRLLKCRDPGRIKDLLEFTHIEYVTHEKTSVFIAKQADSAIGIPLRSKLGQALSHYRVSITLDWPRSKDFGLARRRFLDVENHLTKELASKRELTAVLRDRYEAVRETCRDLHQRLKANQTELAEIKASRVWRVAGASKRVLQPLAHGARRLIRTGRGRQGQPPTAGLLRGTEMRQEQYRRYRAACTITTDGIVDRHQRIAGWKHKPLISVVMPVYNTPPHWLEQAVQSVIDQIYDNWQLCIADDASDDLMTLKTLNQLSDPRIKLKTLPENQNIARATQAAVDMAGGDYILFLDHDDVLSEDALFEIAQAVNDHDPDIVYSDEDFIDEQGEYVEPHFKPDFSPELLLSHNYITHALAVRRTLLRQAGGLRPGYEGAQDYDLLLRLSEVADLIYHVPKVLYHWRRSPASTSRNPDAKPGSDEAAVRALHDAMARRGEAAEVLHAGMPFFYQVKRQLYDCPPVTIIIPFRDNPDLLETCAGPVLEKATYPDLDILCLSNGSSDLHTHNAIRDFINLDSRLDCIEFNDPFNFSAIVNFGVEKARGRHVILMNNDIRIISWDFIESMLEHSQREDVGAVGGKLYYPDNRVQHAGIVVGIDGYAGHPHKHFPARHHGYFNRLQVAQNVSAVTGAFMMVDRGLFLQAGGFDGRNFPIACNDVDFCLRLIEYGYSNVFTPHAQAYHQESASRGYEVDEAQKSRFLDEKKRFAARHVQFLHRGDPYYNPNLTMSREDYTLRLPAPEAASTTPS